MIRRLGSTMPFPPVPPPPPAPAPGVPAARPPPRRPGIPRKAAAPACAPPGPSPPAAAGEKKKRPPERPEGLLSSSWPSATLKRPPARRAPGPAPPRAPPQAAPCRPRAPAACAPARPAGSGHSPAGATASGARTAGSGTAAGAGPDDALRFSLSLTPEAVLLIQRRHMEKQLLARPRRPLPSPSADARRLLAPCPRATAAGLSRRPAPPGGLQALDLGPRPADLRPVLKVSLLNERHKYDDVEYEEEAEVVDEGLVRKCTEWLRGVESAAGRAGPLDALPHLSTL
ncbi:proline-rich protein 18 [Equus przewalskii]|uniref:Proline-rich protein 18 n=1 Tax=Equus przewalskii TaxID=9798 RepID=A0ABM4N393_EQUPR